MRKLLTYQICILSVLYIGYAFYYLTRKSVSFMLPHFSGFNQTGSLNLTKNDIGMIISSQNLAYAISKFFGGILTDVASCRILFGAGLFLSGLLNLGFKKEIKNYQMYYLSFMIGLAQGPAWPCIGKILKAWVPKDRLATWWSVLSTAANVAGALGPIIATSIAVKYHWSYGFMIPGCICMSIGYLSIIVLRNQPSDVDLPNFVDDEHLAEYEEEVQEDEPSSSSTQETSDLTESVPVPEPRYIDLVKTLLSYTFFVSICVAYLKVQLIKTLMSDWSQMYLTRTVKISAYKASYFVSLFELSGIFGSILSGFLSDHMFAYIAKRRAASKKKNDDQPESSRDEDTCTTPIALRMFLVRFYFVALLASLHLFNYYVTDKNTANDWLLMYIAVSTGYLSYGVISLLGIMAMEFAPSKISGTSHAIAALAANVGAIFAGLPFGILSKHYTWNGAFKIIEVCTAFVVLFLLLTCKATSKFKTIKPKSD